MFVYALQDPLNPKEHRYIGWAIDPQKRLKTHLKDKCKTYKVNWLRSLQGRVPSIILLESGLDGEDAKQREIFWIAYFRKLGHRLTNGTDGGDGVVNPTEETRKRMSETHQGKIRTPESCRNQSETVKASGGSPRKGLKMSREFCLRVSEGHKGQVAWNKGLTYHTGGHSCKGRIATFEQREQSRLTHVGVPWSMKRRATYERQKLERTEAVRSSE